MNQENTNKTIYNCTKCDINISTSDELEKCIYCDNQLVKLFNEATLKYDYIIPFNKEKKDAITIFKKYFRKRNLIPKEFKSKKNLDNIKKIYIPIYLYNYDASGEVKYNCDKISKFISKKNKYKKIDTYSVTIGASMSFNELPIYISKKIDENILSNLNLNNLKDYNQTLLNDSLVEYYNLSDEDINSIAESKIKEIFTNKLSCEIKNYDKIEIEESLINLNKKEKKCILIPFWVLKTSYKNKIYNIYLYDNNNKIIDNSPLSIMKLILFSLMSFIISFALIYIILNYVVIL